MAKPATKTTPKKEEPKNLPARREERAPEVRKPHDKTALPSNDVLSMMDQDAGKGLSTSQDDNLVPLINVLQAQSPQVLKRNPAYIEGAEAGDIWLRNSQSPIVKGEAGFLFQPCYFTKDAVEWVPRSKGGGLAGRHAFRPGEKFEQLCERMGAKQVEIKSESGDVVKIWQLKNGNELKETRYHIGYVHGRGAPMAYVIPLSSSGHSFSKSWMLSMNQRQTPSGNVAPSYGQIWRIFTRFKQNNKGEWFMFEAEDAGWVNSKEQFQAGKALYDGFARGDKDIAEHQLGDHGDTSSDNDSM